MYAMSLKISLKANRTAPTHETILALNQAAEFNDTLRLYVYT